jgi:Zn-dependent peptidase ImmA (M78 family)
VEPNFSYARKMARKVIKDYGLSEVPTDLQKIFRSLGLEYIELNDPKDIDGAIIEIEDKPKIAVLNKARPIQRQRFTLAHELGHIFLQHTQRDIYDPEAEREKEEYDSVVSHKKPPAEVEADVFASELLVPLDQIKKLEKDIDNVGKMAEIFNVSKQAMALAVMNYWRYSKGKEK